MYNFTLVDGSTTISIETDRNIYHARKFCAAKNRLFILNTKNELFCGDVDSNNSVARLRIIKSNVIDVDCDGDVVYIVECNGCVYRNSITLANVDDEWSELVVPNPKICPHGFKNLNDKIRVIKINCNDDGILFTSFNKELYAMGDFAEIAQTDVPVRVECFRGLKILQISTGDNFVVVLTHKKSHSEQIDDNVSDASETSDVFLNTDCPKCTPDANNHSQLKPNISKSTTETSMASSVSPSDTFDSADEHSRNIIGGQHHHHHHNHNNHNQQHDLGGDEKTSSTPLKLHKDAAINFLLDLSMSSEDYLIEAGKQTKLLKENVTNITSMVYEGVRTLSRHMSGSDNNDTIVDVSSVADNNTELTLIDGGGKGNEIATGKQTETSDCNFSMSETSSFDMDSTIDLHSESGVENKITKLSRLGGNLIATEVWCFGSVNKGQLGTGDHIKRTRINAVLGLSSQGVMKIDSGQEHSVALTIDGRLFLWGNNNKQQISVENVEDFSVPRRFRGNDNVLDAACGTNHTAILLNNLSIFEQGLRRDKNAPEMKLPQLENGYYDEGEESVNNFPPLLASGIYTIHNHFTFSAISKHLTSEQRFLQESLVAYTAIIKPLLKKISSINNSQIFDHLCQQYLNIINVTALNVKSILEYCHKKITCTDIVALNNCDEMICLYRNFTKKFCDVTCIRGYKTMESLCEKTSQDIQKLFLRPFQCVWSYIDFIYDLIEFEKMENIETNKSFLEDKRLAWEKFANEKDLAIDEATRTLKFWESSNKSAVSKLQSPERRLILDSKEVSLKRSQGGRFTTHWFVLFSDILCHYTNSLTMYPLKTLWIASIQDKDSRKNALKIVTPEETLVLLAQSHEDKMKWLDGIENGIRFCLNRFGTNAKVPQYRNASYTFSEKHNKFPGAKYFGRWYVGNMHGIGHLEFPDGKVYNGQMSNGEIHGFGRMFTPTIGIYEGDFERGKYHGYGVLELQNKTTYEGNFKDGLYHGHGTLINDMFTYVGEFLNNTRHGYGVLDENLTGDKYMGMFADNKKSGVGICITMNGDYFEGIFVNDILSGEGVASFENNSYYEGEMTTYGPIGKGILFLPRHEVKSEMLELEESNIEMEGSLLSGSLSGSWANVKISNGTITMNQNFPKYSRFLGTISIDNDKKWKSLFQDWDIQLFGASDVNKNLDNKQIWSKIAVYITNSKEKEKLKSEGFMAKNSNCLYNNNKKESLMASGGGGMKILKSSAEKLSESNKWNSLDKLSVKSDHSITSSQYSKRSTLDLRDVMMNNLHHSHQEQQHQQLSNKSISDVLLNNLKTGSANSIMDLNLFSKNLEEKFNNYLDEGDDGVQRQQQQSSNEKRMSRIMTFGLDFIPDFGILKCDKNDLILVKEYLTEAFKDLNHPLGVLSSKISHCFYSSYGCWKFKPTSILYSQAMKEWESISRRIYKIIWKMFPALPIESDVIDGETISFRNLLYPILLSEGIYSLLFVLYASKCSLKDEIYRQRIITCEKKTDQELARFLKIEHNLLPIIKSNHFGDAIGCLKQIKDKYSPMEMLKLIEETFQLIDNAKSEQLGLQYMLNADNVMPLIIFLVLRSNIQHLGAEISLLEDLMGTDFDPIMRGYIGYCFTTIKAAYQHILSEKFFQN